MGKTWSQPIGGSGGSSFSAFGGDGKNRRIDGIRVRSGKYIDSIQIRVNGSWLIKHGGNGGGLQTLLLANDEYIAKIDCLAGGFVDKLVFTTNKGRQMSCGGNGGRNYGTQPKLSNRMLVDVQGRCGGYIDCIQFAWAPAHVVKEPEQNIQPIIKFKLNNHLTQLVSICMQDLNQSKNDLLTIKKEKNTSKVVSMCNTFKVNIESIERNLVKASKEMQIEEKQTSINLENNRKEYSRAQKSINNKKDAINRLRGELSRHESELSGYQNRLNELQNDINHERREKKKKKDEQLGVTIAVSIFTGGIGAGICLAVYDEQIKKIQKRIDGVSRERNRVQNNVNSTRRQINNAQREQGTLNQQKNHLEQTKRQLDIQQKRLGQYKTYISNGVQNMGEARIKCDEMILKIDTVKELADIDLLELIKKPLKILIKDVDGTNAELSKIKSITH